MLEPSYYHTWINGDPLAESDYFPFRKTTVSERPVFAWWNE